MSFAVRAGEIVGLAGLVGSGRSEILETVYGARKADRRHRPRRRPAAARRVGAAPRSPPASGCAPEERKSQGLLLDEPVYRNITLSSLRPVRPRRLPRRRRRARGRARAGARRSTSGRPTSTASVRTLSGGNQQKVVLARWLLRDCRVLLLDEPTRGVDVGARAEIYALIRALADRGVAVVVVSSEIEEVLGLADRVLVIARRPRRRTRRRPTSIDEHRVLDLVMEGSAA